MPVGRLGATLSGEVGNVVKEKWVDSSYNKRPWKYSTGRQMKKMQM
jgi:hypothetical protein